jgi:flagellar motility protein MotE (MotC chaperone)
MSKKAVIAGVLSAGIALGTAGFIANELNKEEPEKTEKVLAQNKQLKNGKKSASKDSEEKINQGLEDLSREILVNMNTEKRLNTSMMSQLRAYNSMQKQIQDYAKKVESDIDYIRAISKDEFQEDVRMQAELYSGKKAKKIAKQLEKFAPFRAGAILAQLKAKEAGNVLDVWAKSQDPATEPFYKEVMISYLKNKRYLENAELFNEMKGDAPDSKSKESTS